MILTVTPNAALDVTYALPELFPGNVLRPTRVHRRAGGKGINVARVLRTVGRRATALFPLGGSDGELVRAEIADAGVPCETVGIAGQTRRTTTLLSEVDGSVTLINEPGPEVSPAEWRSVLDAVRAWLPRVSVLVCSGSLPHGVPVEAYAELVRIAAEYAVPSIVDTSGEALRAAVAAGPAVVKPNAEELRATTGLGDPLAAAESLRTSGAGAVLVSLGADGLLACTGSGVWQAKPSRALTGNTTGAGDSAVAGIAWELSVGGSWPEVSRRAVALSAAAVLGPLAGDIDLDHYRHEHRAVTVEEIHATGVNG